MNRNRFTSIKIGLSQIDNEGLERLVSKIDDGSPILLTGSIKSYAAMYTTQAEYG